MGNISTILAAILCATAPIAAVDTTELKSEKTQSNFNLGKQTVKAVRDGYKKGQYNQFFSEMDASFKGADLDGFIKLRKQEIPLEFQAKWEKQFNALQMKKDQDLLSVVSDKDDSVFAEKVRTLAGNLSTPDQEKAVSKINSFIAMAPNSGANEDENTLINIDIEYEYKLMQVQFPKSDVSPQERHNNQLALRMQKMDKMVQASKKFKDHDLKKAVSLASANLDARLARNIDGADLNALVKGKVKPANDLEEKVYSIISSYQGQFNDLLRNLGDAVY